jgi:hypothetical protein
MKVSKGSDLYSIVMKHITKVREQGESPKSDVFSLDTYICDLCMGSISKENIIQCPLCGRWVCRKNCWDIEHRACSSCVGVIILCKDSINLEKEKKQINVKKQKKEKNIKKEKKGSGTSILSKFSKKEK